eukprot:comp22491_c0_seq2/m.33941 comp22491_c0_seq2/g.33941  ORF comp22491_c0_seq2/g.33941 comp22491_c0_seq2/m.33941 type:complete len:112 (-) comp22491_c0_seq2:460-795(-)
MKYKVNYIPSDLLDPVTYQWVPASKCVPLLDMNKYCRFITEEEAANHHGENEWSDPSKVDTNNVLMVEGRSVMPFSYYQQVFECEPETIQNVLQFSWLVGSDLAYRMLLRA